MKNKIFGIIERNYDRLENLSCYEKSVFDKILSCRTEPVPHLFTRCDRCYSVHPVYKSCKDRMCPVCNGSASVKWTAKREAELLRTGYFLLTYTIPYQLRSIFLANKKLCYNLLFKAASLSLLDGVMNNKRKFHGKAGFFGMLHTWDLRMMYHPHIHIVIPAGCLSVDCTEWRYSSPSFFLPVKKISADFRETLLFSLYKELKKCSLNIPDDIADTEKLFERLKSKEWVVNSQAPGKERKNPGQMVKYLSRYVAKSAVSENRIRKVENANVHLGYFDRKSRQAKTEIITEVQLMKRMVLHILPKGFKKVRFFGFMTNRYRSVNLALCRMLLGEPISEQEERDKKILEDTVFLFWKYFKVDITLCRDCGKGHIHFTHRPDAGG